MTFTGMCRVCQVVFDLDDDGLVESHSNVLKVVCPGGLRTPLEGTVREQTATPEDQELVREMQTVLIRELAESDDHAQSRALVEDFMRVDAGWPAEDKKPAGARPAVEVVRRPGYSVSEEIEYMMNGWARVSLVVHRGEERLFRTPPLLAAPRVFVDRYLDGEGLGGMPEQYRLWPERR